MVNKEFVRDLYVVESERMSIKIRVQGVVEIFIGIIKPLVHGTSILSSRFGGVRNGAVGDKEENKIQNHGGK